MRDSAENQQKTNTSIAKLLVLLGIASLLCCAALIFISVDLLLMVSTLLASLIFFSASSAFFAKKLCNKIFFTVLSYFFAGLIPILIAAFISPASFMLILGIGVLIDLFISVALDFAMTSKLSENIEERRVETTTERIPTSTSESSLTSVSTSIVSQERSLEDCLAALGMRVTYLPEDASLPSPTSSCSLVVPLPLVHLSLPEILQKHAKTFARFGIFPLPPEQSSETTLDNAPLPFH